jgi:hypothetical protein
MAGILLYETCVAFSKMSLGGADAGSAGGVCLQRREAETNFDGSVKRPISALRFIPRHCGVL